MKKISLIVLTSVALIGFEQLMANDSSKKEKEKAPLTITIALNKAIEYSFRNKEHREILPVIFLDHQTLSFDAVIMNVTSRNIRIAVPFATLTLKVIDMNGKEYLLSEAAMGSSMVGRNAVCVLDPGGCYVCRIYMDGHQLPKSLFGQKVKLQVIYRIREIILTARTIMLNDNNKKSKKRKIELTKDLNLWHGEIRSSLREVIINDY